MVANIRSGSSPGGALYYNKEKVDKDEAEVLFWQKMLEPFDKHGRMDVDACMDCFWPYLEANRRTTNTVFHASLNPSPEDRLTDEQLRKIACEYMERMGYGEQPYIVFKHKDISREHLHIVSLRVDEQGRKLPHDFEARRSMEILRDLERKYGLHPSVKGQGLTDREGLRKVNYSEGNVKQQISSVARSCLRNYKCSSYGEFRTLLELLNVSVEERTGTVDGRDYAGVIYGAMTDDGYGIGTPFKSSRIGKDVGYKALQKYYERSKRVEAGRDTRPAAANSQRRHEPGQYKGRVSATVESGRYRCRVPHKSRGKDLRCDLHRPQRRHRCQRFATGKRVLGKCFQ